MPWSLTPTGGQNGSPGSSTNADSTQQRLSQNLTHPAVVGQTIYFRAVVYASGDYNGTFEVGAEQLNGAAAYLSTVQFTVANADIPKATWAVIKGRFTTTNAATESIQPFFQMPASATTGSLTVSDFELGTTSVGGADYVGGTLSETIEIQAQIAEDLTTNNGTTIHPTSIPVNSVKAGTHITDEAGLSLASLNLLNRFGGKNSLFSNASFEDDDQTMWDVTDNATLVGDSGNQFGFRAYSIDYGGSLKSAVSYDTLVQAFNDDTILVGANLDMPNDTFAGITGPLTDFRLCLRMYNSNLQYLGKVVSDNYTCQESTHGVYSGISYTGQGNVWAKLTVTSTNCTYVGFEIESTATDANFEHLRVHCSFSQRLGQPIGGGVYFPTNINTVNRLDGLGGSVFGPRMIKNGVGVQHWYDDYISVGKPFWATGGINLGPNTSSEVRMKRTWFGYSGGYAGILIGDPAVFGATAASNVFLGYDPVGNTNGNFNGHGQVIIANGKGIIAPDVSNTSWLGVIAATTSNDIRVGPNLSGGIPNGPVTIGTSTLSISGSIICDPGGGFGGARNNGQLKIYGEGSIGAVISGGGTTTDIYITNKNGSPALTVPTGTQHLKYFGIQYWDSNTYAICAAPGYRFNNSTDAYNNYIIYDNGDTLTRGTISFGGRLLNTAYTNSGVNIVDFRNLSPSGYGIYVAAGGTNEYAFKAASYANGDLFSITPSSTYCYNSLTMSQPIRWNGGGGGAPSMSANGDASMHGNTTYGNFIWGQGTSYDVVLGYRTTGFALGVVANSNTIRLGGSLVMSATEPLYLDGGVDTYIREVLPGYIQMVAEGSPILAGQAGSGVYAYQPFYVFGGGQNPMRLQGLGGTAEQLYAYSDSGGSGWATGPAGSYNNLLYMRHAISEVWMYVGGSRRFYWTSLYTYTTTSIIPEAGAVVDLGYNTSQDFWNAYVRNGVTTGSDISFKKDVTSIDPEVAYAIMSKARGVSYKLIDGGGSEFSYGFIAQELLRLFRANGIDPLTSGVFNYDDKQNRWGLRYQQLIPWMTASTQYRESQLEAKLASQQTLIDNLMERMNANGL